MVKPATTLVNGLAVCSNKGGSSSSSSSEDETTKLSSKSSSSSSDCDDASASSSSDSDVKSSSDESSSNDVNDESLSSFTSTAAGDDLANGLILTLSMVQQLRRSTSSGNVMGDGDRPKVVRQKSSSSDGNLHPKKEIAKVISIVQTRSANELPLHQRLAERSLPSPKETFESIMKDHGVDEVTYTASEILRQDEYFVEGTEVGYSSVLLNAVAKHDLKHVRNHFRIGGNLQCRNRFGESLVHAVVRKSTAEMLDFLIKVGKVSVQVCCDGGRTPVRILRSYYFVHYRWTD
jgi:hypothetical protein